MSACIKTMYKQNSPSWRQPRAFWNVVSRTSHLCALPVLRAVGTFAFAAPEMLLGVDSGVKVSYLVTMQDICFSRFRSELPSAGLSAGRVHTPQIH